MNKKRILQFIVVIFIYIAGVFVYAYVSYQSSKKEEIAKIDFALFGVVSSADLFLKPYHNNTLYKSSIEEAEFWQICETLNKLTSYFKVKYIYSFVKKEDKVLFTSSSFTPEDVKNDKVSKYFDVYDDATDNLKEAFVKKEKVYEEYSDDWGNFRCILLPLVSSNGKVEYVAGVDFEISYIKDLLFKKLMTTTFTGLFFLVLVIPFCFIYISILKKDKEDLEKIVHDQTFELKNINESLHHKNAELKTIANKLSKYLSPQLYESLFTGKMDVKIASSRKYLTVFFSDIKDFTPMTYHLEAEELTELLNRYLSAMSAIATEHGATIDKYIGDALMVFFGDPASDGANEDAIKCVKMAIAMQEKIDELTKEKVFACLSKPMSIRIGIASGYCTVGNFGSQDHMDYTIIGNTVNLASRLEHSAEPKTILISQHTYESIKSEIQCTPRGEISLKGFDLPIKTYMVNGCIKKNTI